MVKHPQTIPGIKNFSHPGAGNKQFFEVGLLSIFFPFFVILLKSQSFGWKFYFTVRHFRSISLVLHVTLDLISRIYFRSSPPEVFLGKGVLKICSKFIGEHPCRSAISIYCFCYFLIHPFICVNLLLYDINPGVTLLLSRVKNTSVKAKVVFYCKDNFYSVTKCNLPLDTSSVILTCENFT